MACVCLLLKHQTRCIQSKEGVPTPYLHLSTTSRTWYIQLGQWPCLELIVHLAVCQFNSYHPGGSFMLRVMSTRPAKFYCPCLAANHPQPLVPCHLPNQPLQSPRLPIRPTRLMLPHMGSLVCARILGHDPIIASARCHHNHILSDKSLCYLYCQINRIMRYPNWSFWWQRPSPLQTSD